MNMYSVFDLVFTKITQTETNNHKNSTDLFKNDYSFIWVSVPIKLFIDFDIVYRKNNLLKCEIYL